MTALDWAILDNEKLVYFTVNRYYPALSLDDDIIQLGRIGLWKAIQTYKPSTSKFGNYAVVCIKHEIDKHFQLQNYPKRKGKTVSLDEEHCDIDGKSYKLANLIGAVYIDTEPFDWAGLRERLTKKERRTLALYLQGYNQAEISRMVGAAPQATSVQMRNIKQKIKKYIDGGVLAGRQRHYRC